MNSNSFLYFNWTNTYVTRFNQTGTFFLILSDSQCCKERLFNLKKKKTKERSYLDVFFPFHRRVLILLDIHIIASGQSVGLKLGNPQPYKAGAAGSQNNNAEKAALQPMVNGG